MKLECKDCRIGIPVNDKSLQLCPQCGSENIMFLLSESEVKTTGVVERSHNITKLNNITNMIMIPIIAVVVIFFIIIIAVILMNPYILHAFIHG